MTPARTRLLKLLLRVVITAALLTFVFARVGLGEFARTFAIVRLHFLFASWAVTVGIFWVNAWKMRLVLRQQRCHVSLSTLFAVSALTVLYSLILPGFLSTGVKWYVLKKETGKGANVLSAMVYNQVSIFVIMLCAGYLALLIANPVTLLTDRSGLRGVLPFLSGMFFLLTAVVCLLMIHPRTGRHIVGTLKRLTTILPGALRSKGDLVLDQLSTFQTAGWRFHAVSALLTIGGHVGLGILLYIVAAAAADIDVPMGTLAWLCALVYVLGRLPISLANLGVREVTLIGALQLYGVAQPSALLMSMILFSTVLFMAIIGAAVQLYWIGSGGPGPESQTPDKLPPRVGPV